MSKVYNKSRLQVEKATKVTCPRCRGFGGCHGDTDKDKICICNGEGKIWKSDEDNGWFRAINARIQDSICW